jgi:hypothetical protein
VCIGDSDLGVTTPVPIVITHFTLECVTLILQLPFAARLLSGFHWFSSLLCGSGSGTEMHVNTQRERCGQLSDPVRFTHIPICRFKAAIRTALQLSPAELSVVDS